jgi:hypothetical protein
MWWGVLVSLIVFWLSLAYAYGPFRDPASARYAYPVAVGLILLLALAYRGRRPSGIVLAGILCLAAVALTVNLQELRERGRELRVQSDRSRATASIYELKRDAVPADLAMGIGLAVPAGDYLAAAERYGGFGWAPEELLLQSEGARQSADAALAAIVRPELARASGARCPKSSRRVGAAAEVPTGGAVLRVGQGGGNVVLRRFADRFTIEAGPLAAGEPARLELPADRSGQPWVASAGGRPIQVCPDP